MNINIEIIIRVHVYTGTAYLTHNNYLGNRNRTGHIVPYLLNEHSQAVHDT